METALKYRNMIDLFQQALAAVTPSDKVCVEIIRTSRRETLTFQELKEQAQAFATWLSGQAGQQRGDKIAIVSKNRAGWDVAVWGAILAGTVPVLIDPDRGPEGVITHLQNTDARCLVMADDYGDEEARWELAAFADAHDLRVVLMTDGPLCEITTPDPAVLAEISRDVWAEDTAVILCTSGTTGDPREVELTHANLVANIQGSVKKVDLTPDDVLGHILPPHHSFGLTVGKFLPLAAGATNVYTNKYREVADLIREKRITIFIAIPALYTTLAKKLEEGLNKQKKDKRIVSWLDRHAPGFLGKKIRERYGWTQVRFFLSGAAPMPRWVLDVLWKRGFRMYEGYGTTENSPVYGFNDRLETLGSVGKPISTLTVKIVDEDNQTLPPRARGEICLGGPCIMKGYYKNPKATEAALDTDDKGVRWLHTGDLGYLDEDGNLYITGRKKYLIILPGGKNVNPERIEAALSEAEFVKEIIVVPTRRQDRNGIMEESVRALVQPAWEALEAGTSHTQKDLLADPQLLKGLIWESVRDCQQSNRQLSSFEKIAAHQMEVHPGEFRKTSTGKIVREHYANLEHLEAKHTRIEEYTPARPAAEPAHGTADAQADGN